MNKQVVLMSASLGDKNKLDESSQRTEETLQESPSSITRTSTSTRNSAPSTKRIRIPDNLKHVNSLRWTAWMLIDWGVIVLAMIGAIHAGHWAAWIGAILVIGNRQHALGILTHDATHYLAFRNRTINDLVSNLFIAWPVMWSTEGYRWWHFNHHRYTGTEKDPELDMKRLSAPSWDLPMTLIGVVREIIKDCAGRGFGILAAGMVLFPPPRIWQRIACVLWPVAITSTLLAFGYWKPVVLWYVAAGTSFPAFMRLRMWLEHAGTNDTHRVALSRIEALVLAPHQTWLHWEHHHYPFVPCFKLEEVRKLDDSVPVLTLNELCTALLRTPKIASGTLPQADFIREIRSGSAS